MTEPRKLRMGMVGGGPGAFIGPVHKMAAELDGRIELVAGAFSQSTERSRAAGAGFGIDPGRAYADYRQMLEAERKRTDAIDFVAIVTPNHLHLPVAVAALEAGFAVVSEKPATATYAEALELEAAVAKAGLPYALTHTYAGYALVREARAVARLPGGHPEGYIEAFAVLYREFADGLMAWRRGERNPLPATLPGIVAGVRGMRFIERAIASSREGSWVEF